MTDQALLEQLRRITAETDPSVTDYQAAITSKNQQFGTAQPPQNLHSLGSLQSVSKTPRGALLAFQQGHMQINFLLPDLVQVRVRPQADFGSDLIPFSYAITQQEWAEVEPVVLEDPATVVVGAGSMACRISRANGHFELFSRDGTALIQNTAQGFQVGARGAQWSRHLPEEEWCYGLGQRASGLHLRGGVYQLWNADPWLYARGQDPCYYSIPFYFGLQKLSVLGILWDNPARGSVDLGKSEAAVMRFQAEAGELRFYAMAGLTPQHVLERYTLLTGRPYLPPLWALGFQQSRYSYPNAARIREVAENFRRHRIPCDVLYFDIEYMNGYRIFTWDQEAFADMPALLKALKGQGFHSVAIVDPGLKVDEDYPPYLSGKAADLFLKYPDGSLYEAPVWAGKSVFPDFTNPAARDWWAQQLADFLQRAPFDGIWNDMNEPVVFTPTGPGTLPDYIRHEYEGQKRTHVEGGHNVYGTQMARATRAGLEKAYPQERPFTLTRAAYAGAQRYSSSWTGDNLSTWDHLKLSISMMLNLGLSGMPFSGPDVGGYGGDTDAELFTRWVQLGSLMPYFRVHTLKGTPDQEPWAFGEPYTSINRRFIELRYRLLPYLYSLMALAHQQGLPLIRPGFFLDSQDPVLRAQDDAFLLGDLLFAAPILEKGATQRMVYLPRGVWFDFWNNQLIDGARYVLAQAPLDTMPLYVRAGAVLPMWQVQQYIGEKPLDEITLRIYAGPGETTLYEDAGTGLGYQQGHYRFSYFSSRFLPTGQYGVDWRTAGNYQPPYERVRVEIVGIPLEPEAITLDKRPAPLWFFDNGLVEVVAPPFHELRLSGRRPDSTLSAQTIMRRPPSF